jgi:hypothetical protein
MIESTPERAVFELDYASDLGGKAVRETKRITVVMGRRMFQCESRFTIDGKAGVFDVAIGLKPQAKGTKPAFSPKSGIMFLWEDVEGLGLGTGIVIDPACVAKMAMHTDDAKQKQALCFARTDDAGTIRWFAGYGWEGQGEIKTAGQWKTYLGEFAAKFADKPFAGN